ncbi:myosin heavy chain kinase B-like [Mangifera indica]|uniref:myosin heavy chain kinase B-like n=1 Tax=Mangifera indica TaxID=29780 RepID=UPI001CF9ABCA|nr:myosin heavy chain kinase B-like [Mangifera indica]
MRKLIIQCAFDKMFKCNEAVKLENQGHCLVPGELCWLHKGRLSAEVKHRLLDVEKCSGTAIDQTRETGVSKDLVEGLTEGNVKFKDMQSHLDYVTGLAVGANTFNVQDFSHVHTFKCHEQEVMAVVCVDEEQPFCISGDYGGGTFIWSTSLPFGQEPIKKWNEPKDLRYSGIHALAISGKYQYTGSGDKKIKAWSLLDGMLSCTMSGHKSVVSTLAVCSGVLYSGSCDQSIRL